MYEPIGKWVKPACEGATDCPVLLDPGLSEMVSLSNIYVTTFAGDAVNARCFEAEVSLDRLKETVDLPKTGDLQLSCYVPVAFH
jgi:hypothetical protein